MRNLIVITAIGALAGCSTVGTTPGPKRHYDYKYNTWHPLTSEPAAQQAQTDKLFDHKQNVYRPPRGASEIDHECDCASRP